MASHSRKVEQYYDENTKLLVNLGHSFEGTIHRAVWGPGTQSRKDALLYVENLIAERVQGWTAEPPRQAHVVDLGCGVGATLCRLASRLGVRGTGITISSSQVSLAQSRLVAAGVDESVKCILGDFCDLPDCIPRADVAYAIESFVLGSDPRAFFSSCSQLVRPGGLLIICDDFLRSAALLTDPKASVWLNRFRQGWVLGSLVDSRQLGALAAEQGFTHIESIDLSSYLELGRPRDRLIGVLMRAFGWLPIRGSYWSMLYGGHALQVALRRDYLKYLFTVWRRNE